MKKFYTDEANALVVLAILKANDIRKVIASPGTTNMALVVSMQNDSHFQIYSAVDERSAAYMACGLAHESGEPVVLSCTGATASRNYLPGLTEGFYRKLPVLAITSGTPFSKVAHLVPQVIDRSTEPVDTHRISVHLPIVKDKDDLWECEVKVNQAILELKRAGGGPVHINLPTQFSRSFDTKSLPNCRVINRLSKHDKLPELQGRISVFIGAHHPFSAEETKALDGFCRSHNAVVFCDLTSGYKGKYRVQYSLVSSQDKADLSTVRPDITIHIGEVSGDYSATSLIGREVWRVSEDGEIHDTFRKLRYVFEMREIDFFELYSNGTREKSDQYLMECKTNMKEVEQAFPEIPFSNIWVARQTAHRIPDGATIHFGILNSLRSWNFFDLPESVTSSANVGGFGIDGGVSSLIGASLANPEKLYFGVFGDLAFFYDLNALGNRHLGKNLRLMVVNNGTGTEFAQYNHPAAGLGSSADDFIAGSGHYGNKSRTLLKNLGQDLGLKYIAASDKKDYEARLDVFLSSGIGKQSVLFEVFTNSEEESRALKISRSIGNSGQGLNPAPGLASSRVKDAVRKITRGLK